MDNGAGPEPGKRNASVRVDWTGGGWGPARVRGRLEDVTDKLERPRRVYVRCIPLPGGIPLPFTLTLEASYTCCSFALNFLAAALMTEQMRVPTWHTCCYWTTGYGRCIPVLGRPRSQTCA